MREPDRNHPYRRYLYRVLQDREWLDRNIGELMSKYAQRWIALRDSQVLAVALSVAELQQTLADRCIDDHTIVFFVPASVPTPV